MGTREAAFCLNTCVQTFLDYEKMCDTVKHDEIIKMIHNTNIDEKDIRVIPNLLETKKRGIFCLLCCLNSMWRMFFVEALEGYECGIMFSGYPRNNILYADDSRIITNNEHDIQLLLIRKIRNIYEKYGLKINAGKTKCMTI